MPKEKEVITQIFEYTDATEKKDYIQEVTEHFTIERGGELKRSEELSYRRVSDRAALKRFSDVMFKVVATGETIILVERNL